MQDLMDRLKQDYHLMDHKEWVHHATMKLNLHYRSMKLAICKVREIRRLFEDDYTIK